MYNEDPSERYSIYGRLTGFPRYRELLENEWFHFFVIGFITLLTFMPFIIGMSIAIYASSILLLIPTCIIGGCVSGPFIVSLYDAILRCLRDTPYYWWKDFKASLRKNWKDSLIPGVIFCFFWGTILFMGMMMWESNVSPSFGTIALYLFCMILFTMIFSTIWPQIALFRQNGLLRFKNSVLFCIFYFFKVLFTAILQVFFLLAMILFAPWSLILLPFLNLWFIIFLSCFILYDTMNQAFRIEESIGEKFPEQIRRYEGQIEETK